MKNGILFGTGKPLKSGKSLKTEKSLETGKSFETGKSGKSLRWGLAIPALLLLASAVAEVGCCHRAQMAIREDLNDTIVALARCEGDVAARQDTIRRLEEINFAMAQPLVMRADQRTPGALLALAVLSALGMVSLGGFSGKRRLTTLSINSTLSAMSNLSRGSTLATISTDSTLATGSDLPMDSAVSASPDIASLRLTPMQRRLVEMLVAAPNHCVAKREICAALWGMKDNAEESLYTLVRRTKMALADAGAGIVCNRGESYEITLP